jgi:hypothetical protein
MIPQGKCFTSVARMTRLGLFAVIASSLAACQQAQPETVSKRPGIESRADATRGLPASPATNIVLSKIIDGPLPAIFVVKYQASDHMNATCLLQVSERGKVVAESRHMIECGNAVSPSMVDVEITHDTRGVQVFQQDDKGNARFLLRRNADAGWILSKVEFIYSQVNPATGDLDVIRETADLVDRPMRVEDYDYERIRKVLVKSTIK